MAEPVDLRSDTVTRPTAAMRAAMAEAEVGDDVWGDDPTVIRLESSAAALVGKEAALFVPSGTMGNQVAVMALAPPATEVLCGARAHIYRSELAGAALHAGVQMRPLPDARGVVDAEAVAASFPGQWHEGPPVSLLCLEQTYGAGGWAVPQDALEAAAGEARRRGAAVHLDGARLFNAAVALDKTPQQLAGMADTVMFCVSKALGAPVGSLLCGEQAVIAHARLIRQRMGGGMRQAGVVAAAGLVALETMVAGLGDDHRRAAALAEALSACFPGSVDTDDVDTNMVFADVSALPGRPVERLAEQGVLAGYSDGATMRLVTHHQVDDEGLARAVEAIESLR